MRFNLCFEGDSEGTNVDIGTMLRWLGCLRFEEDYVVDITVCQHIEEDE